MAEDPLTSASPRAINAVTSGTPRAKYRPKRVFKTKTVAVSTEDLNPLEVTNRSPPDPRDYNLFQAAYSVPETRKVISIGNTKAHDLMNRGILRRLKCGRKTLILAKDIAAYLQKLQEAAQ
jgi:hypothetical protein